MDEIADFEDPSTLDDPIAIALDHTLTAKAFRELPERWQSVLWCTEVEGMDPHEVALLLGMSLSARVATKIDAHLASCTRCAIVCEEADEIDSRLTLVMIPRLLGGVAGGASGGAYRARWRCSRVNHCRP